MAKINCTVFLLVTLLAASSPGQAEVLHAERGGFVIRLEQRVIAPPQTAWRMLVGHVGEWWHSDHTFSGNSENLYIEERPLGCFCERLGPTDAVVHLTVTAIEANKLLRLTGGLGPLGLMGVSGNMVFSLSPDESATNIALEYRVGGYHPEGLDTMAPAVETVLAEQMRRYVQFVESGSPELPPSEADIPMEPVPQAPQDFER